MTKIIAFAGRKQSGKTTSAKFVQDLHYDVSVRDCEIYNFADPLKSLCIDILGLKHNQCYGFDNEKNELVDCYWDNKQLTAREVLQLVGTDMFRKMQHNVWSETTIRKIKKAGVDLAIIADCRFPNEVDTIKKVGGIVIKLNRNPYNSSHTSETSLDIDNYDQSIFDLVIDNDNKTIVERNDILYNFLTNRGLLSL